MSNTNHVESNNTKAFYSLAWASFVIAFAGTVAGLVLLEVSLPVKGFFAMSYIFSITACFTVAKVVRDRHESDSLTRKIEQAKAQKLINEYVEP